MNKISKSCLDSIEPYVVCAAIINTNAVLATYKKIVSLVTPETKCAAVVNKFQHVSWCINGVWYRIRDPIRTLAYLINKLLEKLFFKAENKLH